MILITGAGGFIGKNLIQKIEKKIPDTPIRAFDIQFLCDHSFNNVETIQGSIVNPDTVREAVNCVDVVIHLAAMVTPDSNNISNLFQINVEGTKLLYNAAIKSGCRHFIYLSSAGIYGPPCKSTPFIESDIPRPITPYQQSKWQAEMALRDKDAKEIILNILRPAGIYGAGSYLEIPRYKKVLRKKLSIELQGGVIVQPTHITEVIYALLALIKNPAPHGKVFNFGGKYTLRVQDLEALIADVLNINRYSITLAPWIARPLSVPASIILALTGRKSPLLYRMCNGELFSAAVNDRAFRQHYPNIPTYELKKGIKEHINWAVDKGLLK